MEIFSQFKHNWFTNLNEQNEHLRFIELGVAQFTSPGTTNIFAQLSASAKNATTFTTVQNFFKFIYLTYKIKLLCKIRFLKRKKINCKNFSCQKIFYFFNKKNIV